MLGDYGEVLVMDWGLAKVLDSTRAATNGAPGGDLRSMVHTAHAGGNTGIDGTMAGSVMGTPQFMSPEQARGEVETLDAHRDIYSLGAILYQILSLRAPVTGKDAWEVVGKVGRGEIDPLNLPPRRQDAKGSGREKADGANPAPASLASWRLGGHLPGGRIPDSLAAVVRKAMALDASARYATVAELQRDIESYQGGFATGAEKAGLWKQLTLLVKRHKALFGTATAAWAIITALAVWFVINVTLEKAKAEKERNIAGRERDRATTNAQLAQENERHAVAQEQRATETLGRLRGTAPTFVAQAQALTEKQQFTEALEKMDFAVQLAPAEAEHHSLRGNLLESLSRLAEAKDAYGEALRLQPGHAFARQNRDLCEQILRGDPGPELGKTSAGKLNALMIKQGCTAEAVGTLRSFIKITGEQEVLLKNLDCCL